MSLFLYIFVLEAFKQASTRALCPAILQVLWKSWIASRSSNTRVPDTGAKSTRVPLRIPPEPGDPSAALAPVRPLTCGRRSLVSGLAARAEGIFPTPGSGQLVPGAAAPGTAGTERPKESDPRVAGRALPPGSSACIRPEGGSVGKVASGIPVPHGGSVVPKAQRK